MSHFVRNEKQLKVYRWLLFRIQPFSMERKRQTRNWKTSMETFNKKTKEQSGRKISCSFEWSRIRMYHSCKLEALGNLLCCDWNTNVKLNIININACNRSEIWVNHCKMSHFLQTHLNYEVTPNHFHQPANITNTERKTKADTRNDWTNWLRNYSIWMRLHHWILHICQYIFGFHFVVIGVVLLWYVFFIHEMENKWKWQWICMQMPK